MTTDLTETLAAIQERHIEHSTIHEGKRVNLTSPFCCGPHQMGATGPGLCDTCTQPWPCDAARSARALQAMVEVHRPVNFSDQHGTFKICAICVGPHEYGQAYYPCPTIRAIEDALPGKEDDRG